MPKKQITNLLYATAVVGIALILAYTKGWILTDFESLSAKQAYALLENDENITLLDVRTSEEFQEEHIEGALSIPLQVLNENLSTLQNVKDKKIIVYCHSGTRSVSASRLLAKNGFVPLNVEGGISAWKSDGLSVVKRTTP